MANYIIDFKTKTISPSVDDVVLVKGEHLAQTITFECSSTFNDINLKQVKVAIHSINADGETDVDSTDNGHVTLKTENNKLIISWSVGQVFTSAAGIGKFAVQFYKYSNTKSHEPSFRLETTAIEKEIKDTIISTSNVFLDTFKYQKFLTDRKIPYEYNKVFIIDNKTIKKLTKDNINISAVGDSGVTKLYFIVNDTIDNVNLNSLNTLTFMVYYMTPSGIVSYDTSISSLHYQNDGYILLTWEIPYGVCVEKGNVSFSVGFSYVSNGELKKWYTQASTLTVLNSTAVIDESNIGEINNSKLDELISKVEIINNAYNTLDTKIDTAIADIQEYTINASESEVNAVNAANEAVSALSNLKNIVININNSVDGRVAVAYDCSDKSAHISIFGESTQASTPTIDVPVAITNKFDSDEVNKVVYIANKNLLITPFTSENKITITADKDDYTIYNPRYPVQIIEGVTYTFSFESDGTAGGTSGTDTVQAGLLDTTNGIHYITNNSKSLTFTAKKTGKCSFRYDVNKNGCTHSFWNFMLETGDVKTEYVEGANQSVDIILNEPLRGIPVSSGGNYTDSKGQQYIADVMCEQDGIIGILRYVDYVRVTKSGVSVFKEYEGEDRITFHKVLGSKYNNEQGLCTHLAFASDYSVNSIKFADTRMLITVSSSYTLESFGEWLDSNEVYIAVTCKNNPTFEPLDDDLQTQFKALRTYYGVTNLYNNEGAYNKLDYTADTKLYIDNKFNELTQAILSTGGNV